MPPPAAPATAAPSMPHPGPMPHPLRRLLTGCIALGLAAATAGVAQVQAQAQGVVNLYSSRHYDTDDALHAMFTEQTGIEVNVIEGDADVLLQRIQREGDLSPADVFVAVDAGRLRLATERGLLQPVDSPVLEARVPENLRHPDGLWFGFSKRVRVLLVSPEVDPSAARSYEDLAAPALEDAVLIRSSTNVYNQSMFASIVAHAGPEAAEAWAEGVVANLARRPQGGDRDQIRAAAAGGGGVAVANHYYFARMLEGDDAADRAAAGKLRLVFPNQDGRGAHVNISGAGVVKTAPNRENAVAFLEFLTTPEAQRVFALENQEYPVVAGVPLSPVLEALGPFKEDPLNAAELGEHNREAVRIMDRAGWR